MTTLDFSLRTRALLGDAAFTRLGDPQVAISGLGGVGGAAFMTLVRSGVRRLRIAENGIFDPPDMNRQWGALADTMDRPKIEVYEAWARGINPDIELECFAEGIHPGNIEAFLTGADIYLGAIDIDKGREVKDAGEKIIGRDRTPLFTCGAIGMGAIMINHHPDGMAPDAFWRRVAARSDGASMFPSYLQGFFSDAMIRRMVASFASGTIATCATGASLAGLTVGTEMLVHLLQGSGLVDRAPIFAPRFVTIDLARMEMGIHDVTS